VGFFIKKGGSFIRSYEYEAMKFIEITRPYKI
jgi:hypothetical protein